MENRKYEEVIYEDTSSCYFETIQELRDYIDDLENDIKLSLQKYQGAQLEYIEFDPQYHNSWGDIITSLKVGYTISYETPKEEVELELIKEQERTEHSRLYTELSSLVSSQLAADKDFQKLYKEGKILL